ncbi:hypothetical protein ACFE04_023623 [Oxalis oulophora]
MWDLYGYMYGYGNAGPEVVEEKTNPEVAEGPGTSSEHIIAPPRKNVGSSSSRAPQVNSTSQLTQLAHPTRTSNKVTSKTQHSHPSQTTQPTRTSNKVKSTSQPTASSPRPTTRSLSQGKESAHLAPPPLYLGHSRFKRSDVNQCVGFTCVVYRKLLMTKGRERRRLQQ